MKANPDYRLTVSMGGESIDVYSESTDIVRALEGGLNAVLSPGMQSSNQRGASLYKLTFVEAKAFSFRLDSQKTFYLKGNLEELASRNAIVYIVQYALERVLAVVGKTTTHAAAVSANGNGILLLGKQGSGKTTVCTHLCRSHGCRLIGNDLCVIGVQGDSVLLFDGSKTLRYRYSSFDRYNQDLKKFPNHQGPDAWTTITVLDPCQIDIECEAAHVPLVAAFYVHVMGSDSATTVSHLDPLFTKIYLHQNLTQYISGNAITPLVGDGLRTAGFLHSLEDAQTFAHRVNLIERLSDPQMLRYISGPLDDISSILMRAVTGGEQESS